MLRCLQRKRGRRGERRALAAEPVTASVAPEGHPIDVRLTSELAAALESAHNSLRVVARRAGSAMTVYATGDIDASNVSALRRILGTVGQFTPAPGPLIVETSEMEFMAVCAFAALAEEADRFRRRGIALRLVSNQAVVRRVLSATGLSADLSVFATIADALADVQYQPSESFGGSPAAVQTAPPGPPGRQIPPDAPA